jgi:hypothetical protein
MSTLTKLVLGKIRRSRPKLARGEGARMIELLAPREEVGALETRGNFHRASCRRPTSFGPPMA